MANLDYTIIVETKDVLLDIIQKNNRLYRSGKPAISDAEYDALVEKLKEIDPENEWFDIPEPVSISNKRKVSLPIQMASLNKAKTLFEIEKWRKSLGLSETIEVICMPKFDGLSLLYDEITGKAYSRGGKENEGQDCTEHAKSMGLSVSKEKSKCRLTFGEVVIKNSQWDKYFKGKVSPYSGEVYKSPRNTAAGLLNRDNPSEELRHTQFYRYGVDSTSLSGYSTYEDLLSYVCMTYKQLHLYDKLRICQLDDNYLFELYSEWSKLYPIDGIVIYINDLEVWKTVDRHQSTGNPLYAIAYKHPDFTESFETTVKSITWNISKSGALKPVVNIESVDTGDCCMENPTGYNAGWIDDRSISNGAKIIVTRSGGVIPKILKASCPATKKTMEQMWDDLSECPCCGSPTIWSSTYTDLYCSNKNCPDRILAKIIFFYNTCGIENFGDEGFKKLFDSGYNTIKRVLCITFDELMSIDGFGESISNNILDTNKKIMEGLPADVLMHASDCFEGIGTSKARKILNDMAESDLEKFYSLSYDIVSQESDSKTMQAFRSGIPAFYEFVKNTGIQMLPLETIKVDDNGKYTGESICFSGVRDKQLGQKIIAGGGKVVSSVSKNTTMLIVKDKSAFSTKIEKAKSLDIKIMNIDEMC